MERHASSPAVGGDLPYPPESRTALILVGHGSHLNPDSSAPVYAHAERIRVTGRYHQVLEAFWKEEPSLRDAIDLAEAERVIIVPLFLAEGYFTRQLLPRELGIDGALTRRSGRDIAYAEPVGTHRAMAGMIADRARDVFGKSSEADLATQLEPGSDDTALVIIGHGTERSPTSGDTVYRLTEELRERGIFREVTCGFLDEAPEISAVLAGVRARKVVLVPFFVAEGWHTRETIPADLALDGEVTQRGDRTIWYTPPVGTLPGIADVVLEIAGEAERGMAPAGDFERRVGDTGPVVLAEARAGFFEWLDAAGKGVVMQVALHRTGTDSYAARHVEDCADGDESLPMGDYSSHYGEASGVGTLRFPQDDEGSSALRRAALDLVRFNAEGAYRPLRTAPDLRRGWAFADLDRRQLWELLSVIYPASVLHAYRLARRSLEVVDFAPWAARQTAMYAGVRDLPIPAVADLTRALCDPCRRYRLWRITGSETTPTLSREPQVLLIPCREPCTVFATEARERRSPPSR